MIKWLIDYKVKVNLSRLTLSLLIIIIITIIIITFISIAQIQQFSFQMHFTILEEIKSTLPKSLFSQIKSNVVGGKPLIAE